MSKATKKKQGAGVIYDSKGRAFSKWKPSEKFKHYWQELGLKNADTTEEFIFDAVRKWRFDFAWPSEHVAVEIDGFGFGHQAQQRLSQNNEKQNAAVRQGWRVLRFDSRLLGSKQGVIDAVELVNLVLTRATDRF